MTTSNARREIVVGIDGSPSSLGALGWAVDEAAVLDATVAVVTAWHAARSERDKAARMAAAERVALGAAGRYSHGKVQVTARAVAGEPSRVLVGAARGALLLVVGSRGRGVVVGTLLGSVALDCMSHATCPVVIVRDGVTARHPTATDATAVAAVAAVAAGTIPAQPAADASTTTARPIPLGRMDPDAGLHRHLAAERYHDERGT